MTQPDQNPYREALLRKRSELLAAGGAAKPLAASTEMNTRQGDLADQASGNNEVHIALKLKQTDAKILQAIEEALVRLESEAPLPGGLLALGQRAEQGFETRHGSELLVFLGRVLTRSIGRWLIG